MNRRHLLSTAALAALGLSLGGCTASSAPQWASDVALVAQGAQSLYNSVVGATNIPSSVSSQVNAWLQKVNVAATDVSKNFSKTSASTVIQYAEQIAEVVVPLIPGVGPVASAILALAPAILAAIGAVVPPAAAPGGMTAAQARAILQGAH